MRGRSTDFRCLIFFQHGGMTRRRHRHFFHGPIQRFVSSNRADRDTRPVTAYPYSRKNHTRPLDDHIPAGRLAEASLESEKKFKGSGDAMAAQWEAFPCKGFTSSLPSRCAAIALVTARMPGSVVVGNFLQECRLPDRLPIRLRGARAGGIDELNGAVLDGVEHHMGAPLQHLVIFVERRAPRPRSTVGCRRWPPILKPISTSSRMAGSTDQGLVLIAHRNEYRSPIAACACRPPVQLAKPCRRSRRCP